MTTPPIPTERHEPRDTAYWANQASYFKVVKVPTGALNLNVEGHKAVGPLQGFGQLWQKTYQVRLKDAPVTPAEIIKTWKENFSQFWPKGNRFFAPLTGLAPGAVAILDLGVPGMVVLETGVLVLYADDESFTFVTPQGHMFASWITFRAYEEGEHTIVQIYALLRANDPLYEIATRLHVIPLIEDKFWMHTLKALVAHFGMEEPVQLKAVCIDPRIQWSQAGNIWQNAGVRTAMYIMMAPVRWLRNKFKQ